jgi:putative tryptophan/tyrosine transport system substrate-binding protein
VPARTLVLAWLLAWTLAGAEPGGPPIVVRSGDQAPYLAAVQGLRRVLPEIVDEPGAALAQARVVVAVGSDAAATLARRGDLAGRLVFCLVGRSAAERLPAAIGGVLADVAHADQAALIARALPKARRIGVLVRSGAVGAAHAEAVQAACPPGMLIVSIQAESGPGLADAIDRLLGQDVDAVWALPDGPVGGDTGVRALLLGGLRHRVPVVGWSPPFVRAGALVGLGGDPASQGEQAGRLAQRILAGEDGASIGRHAPERVDLAVNLVVARKLVIDLPPSLIAEAAVVVRP